MNFNKVLDKAPIAATSIFNGAFTDILTYNVPFFDSKKKMVGYWDDPDWHVDFTSMDDTAAYTAAAALDAETPKALCIASFQVSARDLAMFTKEVLGTPFDLEALAAVKNSPKRTKKIVPNILKRSRNCMQVGREVNICKACLTAIMNRWTIAAIPISDGRSWKML